MKDFAAAYFEALASGAKELAAFEAALKVYMGHRPTVREGTARRAVAKIVAEGSQDNAR